MPESTLTPEGMPPPERTVTAPAELDLTAARAWKAEIGAAGEAAAGGTLTLDLTPTRFLDSAGLEGVVLALRRQKARGYALRVRVRAGTQPQRVLHISRLDALVPISVVPA